MASRRIKLRSEQIEQLVHLPEQGMGYQLVDLRMTTGELHLHRVVLNSEFLLLEDNELLDPENISTIEISKEST